MRMVFELTEAASCSTREPPSHSVHCPLAEENAVATSEKSQNHRFVFIGVGVGWRCDNPAGGFSSST